MRRIAILFIAFCAASAQDDPRARARELERQAEKALDEGRRTDALKLLAEAADLREKARDRIPFDPKNPDAKDEPVPHKAGPAEGAGAAVESAFKELDGAVGKGDGAAALKAALRAREALAVWQRDLEARERKLAEARTPVEQRLDDLERKVKELRALVEGR